MYCALDYRHEENVFTAARYVISICMLMLVKESGMLLSIFSLLVFAFCQAPDRKTSRRPSGWILKPALISIGCMFACKLAWSHLLKIYKVSATGSWISWDFLSSLLFYPTQEQTDIMSNYLNILCERGLFEAPWGFWGTISWVKVLILAVLAAGVFSLILRDGKTTRALYGAICVNIFYAVSLMVQYVRWNSYSSYIRYINTGWIAVFAFLFMAVLHAWERPREKNRQVWFRAAVLYCLFLAILIFPLKETRANSIADCYAEEQEYAEKITAAIDSDQPERNPRDLVNVFLMNDGTVNQVLHHHQLYNQLLTKGIAIRNWCYDTSLDPHSIPGTAKDGQTDPIEDQYQYSERAFSNFLFEKLINATTGRYDYLYVANIPEAEKKLYNLYPNIFTDGIEEHRLYRITNDRDKVAIHAVP